MVLLRMFCVGSYPSSQMYSSFALSIIGITCLAMRTVYETYAVYFLIFTIQMRII